MPSEALVLHVPVLTDSNPQEYKFHRLWSIPYTPFATLKPLLDRVTRLAQGDLVIYYWSRSPLRCGDYDDLVEQCLGRYGTNRDISNYAYVCDLQPDDTYQESGIEGEADVDTYLVQLIALIHQMPATGSRPSSLERQDSIQENAFPPEHILTEARKRPSPSTGAAISVFMEHQKAECADAAYDARPSSLMPSPIIIYDRTVAQFSQHIAHPTSEFEFTKEELARAKKFATTSMHWYASETERQAALEPIINIGGSRMFECVRIHLGGDSRMVVNGDIPVYHDDQIFHIAFTELKNGEGTALNRVELCYMKLVSSTQYARVVRVSCCPMFLIVVIGNTMSVWGAVFGDRFMFEPLCSIQLGPSPNPQTISKLPSPWLSTRHPVSPSNSILSAMFNTEHPSPLPSQSHPVDPVLEDRWDAGIRELAKVLRCLDHAIEGLRCYYSGLQLPAQPSIPQSSSRTQQPSSKPSSTISPASTSPSQARFPFWTSFTSEDEVKHDLFYLARLTDEISKPIFKARMTASTGDPVDVVVKFAFSYGEKGHRLLASLGKAPALHYCKYERDVGMWVVVMELLDGGSLRVGSCLTRAQSQSLKAALDVLHENKLVFGDLREPNIVFSDDDEVKLVDFDWCGEAGAVRYPATINLTGDIMWHPEVYGGQRIAQSHDMFRLEAMSSTAV